MRPFLILITGLSLFSANIATVLHRFFVHLSLVILFAFTQLGVATHEISHYADLVKADLVKQSQQDQNTPNHQCEQCLSHAGVANGLTPHIFVFSVEHSVSTVATALAGYFSSTSLYSYSARAPPQIA